MCVAERLRARYVLRHMSFSLRMMLGVITDTAIDQIDASFHPALRTN
jgi:hypothetical protein